MAEHEFDRPPATTHRAPEPERTAEPDAPRTTESAVLRLQRAAGNDSVSALLSEDEPSPVHEVVGSGADFSDVRVHTGAKADQSARSIGAQAYTVGTDVVFSEGAYQPETPSGRHVLAHELAHVVQQKAGPVSGTPGPGGVSVSHPSDPFEQAAERTADQVMAQRETAEDEEVEP